MSNEKKLFKAIQGKNIKVINSILDDSNKNKKILNLNDIKHTKNECNLFLLAVFYNNIDIVNLLIEYANQNNIVLKLNEINKHKEYPLFLAVRNNNIGMVDLLMKYSKNHNITLKLNEKTELEYYPLILAIDNNKIDMIKLLIEYAYQNNIVLALNDKDKYGDYPFLIAVKKENIEIIKLLIEYANHYNIILALNEKNEYGNYPFLIAIKNENSEIIKLLIEYANSHYFILEYNIEEIEINDKIIARLLQDYEKNKNNLMEEKRRKEILEIEKLKKNPKVLFDELLKEVKNNNFQNVKTVIKKGNRINYTLEINKKDKNGNSILYWATKNDNTEITKYLIEYAESHNIPLSMNDFNNDDNYSLLNAAAHNNIEMIKLLLDYLNKNGIILNINKQNIEKNYPLDWAIYYQNTEMIELLIEYAEKNSIILDINQKDESENNPLIKALGKDNDIIIELLTEYAKRKNIILYINENDIKNIFEIKEETINLLLKYEKEQLINIEYKTNGKLKSKILEREKLEKEEKEEIQNILLKDLWNEIGNNNHRNVKNLLELNDNNNYIIKLNRKDKDGNNVLHCATKNDNIDIVKHLIEYAECHNIILKVNDQNNEGIYSLLNAIANNNIEMAKLLMAYAKKNGIVLNINSQSMKKSYPLDWAIHYHNIDMINLLIEYANNNNTLLNVNQKNENENYPIVKALGKNDIEIIKILVEYTKNKGIILCINEDEIKNILDIKEKTMELLFEYEKDHLINIEYKNDGRLKNKKLEMEKLEEENEEKIKENLLKDLWNEIGNNNFEKVKIIFEKCNNNDYIIELNKKDRNGNTLLYWATKNNNIKIVNLLMEYSKNHNIILKINDQNNDGIYSLLNAIENNNIEMAKLLIDYASNNDIIININKQSKNKNYPLDFAVYHDSIEMVKLLMEYAENNNIPLNINQKSENDRYPLMTAIVKNKNGEMIDLFMDYANNNYILLNINQKCDNENYPLEFINNENFELFEIIIKKYAEIKNITLNLNENKIKINVKNLNFDIIESLKEYNRKGRISIEFKEKDSELLERFNKIYSPDRNENINNYDNKDIKEYNIDETVTLSSLENFLYLLNLCTNEKLVLTIKSNLLKIIKWKFTPLILACYFNDEKWVKELINNKVNINAKNSDYDTAFSIASYFNYQSIIKLLKSKKADTNIKNNNKGINHQSHQGIINEMHTRNNEKPIDTDQFNSIVDNSVFQIEYDIDENKQGSGTGFFVRLPIPSKNNPMFGLMTCNHVIKSEQLIENFKFDICMKNKGKKTIILNECYFNGRYLLFTSPIIDITFIQLSKKLITELGLKKGNFLIPCANYENNENLYNHSVWAVQYPKGDCHFSFGIIKSVNGFDYLHNISTDEGSSGSPLINGNFEVIGVHKSKRPGLDKNEGINIATNFSAIEYAIRLLYDNRSLINIKKARISPKILDENEIEKLKRCGILMINNEVFVIPKYDDSSREIYLYRSNHSWYWTKEIYENTEGKKYSINNLKLSKWNIIKLIKNNSDDIDYQGISHQQKVRITYLGLSGLMYLNEYKCKNY